MAAKFSRFAERVDALLTKQGGIPFSRWRGNGAPCPPPSLSRPSHSSLSHVVIALAALAVQTAFSRVPQIRPARQLASELRHRTVHCDTTHYRGFARLVRSALFQVEQHLEFFYFHTLTVFVAKLTYE